MFFEACLKEYDETNISGKKLSKLTPRQVAVAIGVELALLSSGQSVFEESVYTLLSNLPVDDGKYTLDLINVLYQFLSVCEQFEDTDFAEASFGSLYKTWTDKANFDRNYNLNAFEANLEVDGANLSQLLKVWIFLMSEMFHRFFCTYDPRETDNSKAYYTIMQDTTKRKRTSADFLYFLSCINPIYAQLCMISADKSEIHKVFAQAAADAKAEGERMRQKREAMRTKFPRKSPAKGTGKGAAKGTGKGAVKTAAAPIAAPKPQITLGERMKQLESNLKAIQNPEGKTVIELPPAPASVWKKPWQKKEEAVPAAAAAAAAESESESDSEEVEQPVAAAAAVAATSDEEGEFIAVNSRKTKTPVVTVEVTKNKSGRTQRIFSALNKKQ
jgi:hypothetical protein